MRDGGTLVMIMCFCSWDIVTHNHLTVPSPLGSRINRSRSLPGAQHLAALGEDDRGVFSRVALYPSEFNGLIGGKDLLCTSGSDSCAGGSASVAGVHGAGGGGEGVGQVYLASMCMGGDRGLRDGSFCSGTSSQCRGDS